MRNVKEKNGRLSAQETLALWQAYKESGDPRLRDRLVLTFAPMVKYIVYRKVREIPARCEVEDFISCGLEALIRSIDRYDPEKGATLEQFAWTRIHGAVLDELRRNDWAPRSLRRWDRDINKAREQFIGLYGRPPTNAELADSLGIDDLRARPPPGRDHPLARRLAEHARAVRRRHHDRAHRHAAQRGPRVRPVHAAMRDDAKTRFRAAFEQPPAARSQGRRAALRLQPDPA